MGKKVDAIITGYPFKQKEQEGVLTLKKFLAVLMVCVAVLQVSPAHSKIMRDVKLGQPCTFDNNAEITLRDFSFVNEIALTENWTLPKLSCARDEEIALLKAEIANLRTNNVTFGKEVALSLAVLYKGKTFYNGFVGQYSFNEPGHLMWRPALSKPHYTDIGPEYSREFAFFCFLPKRVINDKKSSLQMILKIGDDELTYNIRK